MFKHESQKSEINFQKFGIEFQKFQIDGKW